MGAHLVKERNTITCINPISPRALLKVRNLLYLSLAKCQYFVVMIALIYWKLGPIISHKLVEKGVAIEPFISLPLGKGTDMEREKTRSYQCKESFWFKTRIMIYTSLTQVFYKNVDPNMKSVKNSPFYKRLVDSAFVPGITLKTQVAKRTVTSLG